MHDAYYIPTSDAADDVLIFPIGRFYRGGKERQFTAEDAALMVQNYEDNVLQRAHGQLPVNAEHKRENGKIASITSLRVADDGVRGNVDGDVSKFDYLSPEVRWSWTDPYTGAEHKNVLMGAAATNYPFFLGKMALHDDALLWTGSEWQDITPSESGGTVPLENVSEVEMPEDIEQVPVEEPTEELATEPEVETEDYAEKIASLEA